MWSHVFLEHSVEFQYGGRLGEFNGMLSQSHVSHCRTLPLGKFTVTIPEPHATLQRACNLAKSMSWSCHIAGCKNSTRHIENRFRHILFIFVLMQFRLWRVAAFVSSRIHFFLIIIPPWKNQFVFEIWGLKLCCAVLRPVCSDTTQLDVELSWVVSL